MNIRTALPLSAALVVAAGALAPALAAPPKPITEEWAMELAPVPAPLLGVEPVESANSCVESDLEGISISTKTFKTVGAGTLVVDVTEFAGDWDITITDDKGAVLGIGEGTTTLGEAFGGNGSIGTDNAEKATIKINKAMTLNVHVCNYLGGPEAAGKYVFTYK